MNTPALNKFLFVLSLATIATTVIANPAFAEPTTYQGSKVIAVAMSIRTQVLKYAPSHHANNQTH
jgi:hypothetical protein